MAPELEPYLDQARRWPAAGRHVLARFDERAVVVYQAFRPEIGRFAAEHGRFGDGFRLDRMSWIKPGFLWMMHRSAWGTAEGQEVVLAVRVRREAFDRILAQAVPSAWDPTLHRTREEWSRAVAESDVRLQWDPDHDPLGRPEARRAIQLGLRGASLAAYAGEWLDGVEDVSGLVAEQRAFRQSSQWAALRTPREDLYPVPDPALRRRLCLQQNQTV